MKNCIACGALVPLYNRYCYRCGVYLPETLFGKEQAEEEEKEKKHNGTRRPDNTSAVLTLQSVEDLENVAKTYGSSSLPPLVLKLIDNALVTEAEVLAVQEKYWKELYDADNKKSV